MTRPKREREEVVFSKPNRKQLIRALCIAIEAREGLIDAHHCALAWRKGRVVSVIPREYKVFTDYLKREIKIWQKLRKKLSH